MSTLNVTKRGDKWQYRFEAASVDGKRKRVSKSGFKTKKEAVEALVALGYGQAESLKAVNALEDVETMDSGAILKAALKKLF